MNYIYDIILNFNEEIYDFYEWNNGDNITHIRKIPILRINTLDLKNLKDNNVIFEEEFVSKIKNKTEIFSGRTIKNLEYSFLVSDGLEVIGINIKNKRNKYSKLILNEESEVLEVVNRIKESEIKYQIMSIKYRDEFKTRKEKEIYNYVLKELKKLEKENNIEKLKYISYECFSEKIDSNIFEYISDRLEENYLKLYKIFKLIYVSR